MSVLTEFAPQDLHAPHEITVQRDKKIVNQGATDMKVITRLFASATALLLSAGLAHADSYSDTVRLFRNAGESASFFSKSYAYAVFPTVGEAGFIVGGARGDGRVYGSTCISIDRRLINFQEM
jgi:hypothetical protein